METLREGLDAFESEICAHPVLEVVTAYPGGEPRRATRASVKRPVTVRRLTTSLFHTACAAALFPLVVMSWFILRIWWLLRLVAETIWRGVAGTGRVLRAGASAAVATARAERRAMVRLTRVAGKVLLPAAPYDGPPVIRVAMVGVPRWVRHVRIVPAIALMLWTAAGISVGAVHLLTLRLPERVTAPPPRAPRPAAAPTLVTVIMEFVPEPPAKE